MASAATPFQTRANKNDLLPLRRKQRFQNIFAAQAVRSYLYLSLGIGVIAVLLPVLLVIAGGYSTHDSISSFYHDKAGPARDIMVGSLCAIGVFLFLFHGLSNKENWLLNVAGVAIITVALVPSPGDTDYGNALIHRGAAILFFILIGIVAIFLAKGRITYIKSDRKRLWFATAYNVAGTAMIALPLIVVLLQQFLDGRAVLLAEWAAIWSFAAYWFLKTFEYRLLLRIRWID